MKPRLFIGSSSENLEVAYAVQENLEAVAEVTVWIQGVFNPSRYNLESLADALFETDFGVFVFAPNDVTSMRGQERATVRDNVVFELGMFVGRLGRERCFILVPRAESANLHLPSDLLGLSPAAYDANRTDGNVRAALGPACSAISRSVAQLGKSDLSAKPTQSRTFAVQPVLVQAPDLTKAERLILKAMVTGSFNERSLTGLSRDTGLPKSEVNACVTSLMRKGLVQQRTGQRSGQPRWFPTEAGRLLAGG
jgi:hypothetical protein